MHSSLPTLSILPSSGLEVGSSSSMVELATEDVPVEEGGGTDPKNKEGAEQGADSLDVNENVPAGGIVGARAEDPKEKDPNGLEVDGAGAVPKAQEFEVCDVFLDNDVALVILDVVIVEALGEDEVGAFACLDSSNDNLLA